jgi:ABC-2 type transport system permease protein
MAMGFLAASVLVYYGVRVQSLVFMMGYLLMPLSGVSYELDVLPKAAQYIASLLPMSYIFEFMRLYILKSVISWNLFGIVTVLNVIYFSASIACFNYMFEKSREKGLARLVD